MERDKGIGEGDGDGEEKGWRRGRRRDKMKIREERGRFEEGGEGERRWRSEKRTGESAGERREEERGKGEKQ